MRTDPILAAAASADSPVAIVLMIQAQYSRRYGSKCGGSNFAILRLPSHPLDAADIWLKGDGSPPNARLLIESNQG